VSQTIFNGTIGAGWGWRPYYSKNTQLLVRGGAGGKCQPCVCELLPGMVAWWLVRI
jgi:hypothetical protein